MMRKLFWLAPLFLMLLAIGLAPRFSAASPSDVSMKAYSEIVGDRPVATLENSDDEPAQTNIVGEGFSGDSWYEAGITITGDAGSSLWGWASNDDPCFNSSQGIDVLLSLDEPATEFGFNWGLGAYVFVSLYSDTNHSTLIGDISFSPSSDGETHPGENGYDLGILSSLAFQSVRIHASSSTYATIDDLVYVPSPEPALLIAQLGALLTLSLLCWKRR